MSLEGWKAFLEIGGVVLLALTVVFGASALIVNNRLNAIQAEQLRQFDKALTDAKSENLKLQTILLPRRIPIRPKEGDRVRIERHAEVVKYSRTYALIQSVPDFESQILAFDISSALVNDGWATDIVGEDRTHISPRLIKDGVRVITLELYPFTLNSQPRTVAPSKTSDAAKA